jgi:hypothetical protein
MRASVVMDGLSLFFLFFFFPDEQQQLRLSHRCWTVLLNRVNLLIITFPPSQTLYIGTPSETRKQHPWIIWVQFPTVSSRSPNFRPFCALSCSGCPAQQQQWSDGWPHFIVDHYFQNSCQKKEAINKGMMDCNVYPSPYSSYIPFCQILKEKQCA